ncbi:MAG TPA: ester cyclase [Gemmatimonadaceae bacterium]
MSTIEESVALSSDCKIEVRSTHPQNQLVITRTWLSGTHTGPVFGVDGTGRAFRVPMLDAFLFHDGKVWLYLHLADHLPLLKAIGAEVRVGERVATLD